MFLNEMLRLAVVDPHDGLPRELCSLMKYSDLLSWAHIMVCRGKYPNEYYINAYTICTVIEVDPHDCLPIRNDYSYNRIEYLDFAMSLTHAQMVCSGKYQGNTPMNELLNNLHCHRST